MFGSLSPCWWGGLGWKGFEGLLGRVVRGKWQRGVIFNWEVGSEGGVTFVLKIGEVVVRCDFSSHEEDF